MRSRCLLISGSTLTLTPLIGACGLPASTTSTATLDPPTAVSTRPATPPLPTPTATVASVPSPSATAAGITSPASTVTRASIPAPTPPTIDPAFILKLAAIPPEDLQWLIRRGPIGQDEVPSNLTDPSIGGADIFTTSGPILAVLFIGFRENTHRAFYNIYHTADLTRQAYDGVIDLYRRTPG